MKIQLNLTLLSRKPAVLLIEARLKRASIYLSKLLAGNSKFTVTTLTLLFSLFADCIERLLLILKYMIDSIYNSGESARR